MNKVRLEVIVDLVHFYLNQLFMQRAYTLLPSLTSCFLSTLPYSLLDTFPVPGRKDYPLLFDQNGQPKKAYNSVVNF